MKTLLAVLLLLAGCALSPPPVSCPPPIAEPAPAPRHPSTRQIGALEIRVELNREQQRQRADACADSLAKLRMWISKYR